MASEHHRFSDEKLNDFHQEFLQLKDQVEEDRKEREELRDSLDRNTRAIQAQSELIREAFPKGDAVAHRIAHEAMIKREESETEFWQALKLELAKKGLWAVIIMLIGLSLSGMKEYLSRLFH